MRLFNSSLFYIENWKLALLAALLWLLVFAVDSACKAKEISFADYYQYKKK
jgi:hypothetical protein